MEITNTAQQNVRILGRKVIHIADANGKPICGATTGIYHWTPTPAPANCTKCQKA